MGNSAQKEQLKSIATRLSEERQKKSISLEEIAAKTYIPQRLLSAIEDANLDRLPEPVFIQGFIRRYADAIGLDGTALSKEFTVDLSPLPAPTAATLISSTPEPPLKPVVQNTTPLKPAAPPPKPAAPVTPLPTPKPQEPELVRDEPKLKLNEPKLQTNQAPSRLPLIALGGAIALGVIGILTATLLNRPAERSTPVATTAVQSPKPSIAPPSPTTQATAKPSPSPSPAGAVGVKMNVNEDSWVEVLVDGNPAFEGTLPKGTQRSWSGKQQVVVTAGNAGGVALSYNNATFKPMGSAGEVQSATFPPTP
ncbi:helix-turn-helix domain-containing protein [Leptolyngbya sp. NIES-2104]|uniref:helix-turn-helix domain-containing protein n=1 Tax=Leptolyngbya sp. NIES-2104 TaxID=1552121 RepID=UPI0006EC63B9|nr:helix-turn-helix domain-containing protein [Leptolyngbya sp. NIES-2104]GAP99372.1 transcriptional regulator [Leptolyngbya sp. NIES-2104]